MCRPLEDIPVIYISSDTLLASATRLICSVNRGTNRRVIDNSSENAGITFRTGT